MFEKSILDPTRRATLIRIYRTKVPSSQECALERIQENAKKKNQRPNRQCVDTLNVVCQFSANPNRELARLNRSAEQCNICNTEELRGARAVRKRRAKLMQNIGKVHPARQRIVMEQRVSVEFKNVLHQMLRGPKGRASRRQNFSTYDSLRQRWYVSLQKKQCILGFRTEAGQVEYRAGFAQ